MDIKVITAPSVRLVGRLEIDGESLDGFLRDEDAESWTTDTEVGSEKLVEVAGRLCYKSYAKPRPGGNAAYIGHILDVAHGSVVEHAVYSLIITGVSRSFSHELVRHRAGFSYSQRSQRFCDEAGGAFVVPSALLGHEAEWRGWAAEYGAFSENARARLAAGDIAWTGDPPTCPPRAELYRLWRDHMRDSQEVYKRISDALAGEFSHIEDRTLRRKKAREAARSVLPNAAETQIFVTANGRALRHFIEARGDASADAEIRAVALAMLAILRDESPNIFGDYEVADVAGVGPCISCPGHRRKV